MADRDFRVKNGLVVSANNSLVVDSANNRVAINAASSNIALFVNASDAIGIPSGNTLQRPTSPQSGFTRYNTDLGYIEVYTGAAWQPAANNATPPTTPTGSNTWVQYNASGGFGANSRFTFDVDTNRLHIGNSTVNTFVNSVAVSTGNVLATSFIGTNGAFSSLVTIGANVSLSTTTLSVGNSTVNTVVNSSIVSLSNTANLTASSLTIGSSVINSSMIAVGGSNVWTRASLANVSQLTNDSGYITNVNTSLGYIPASRAGDTFTGTIAVGANLVISTSTITIGNSTINTVANAQGLTIQGGGSTATVNSTMFRIGTANVWTTASLANVSQLVNDSGYISNVNTSLGYVPANRAGDTFTGTVNVGANATLEFSRLRLGNSTVNAVVNTSGFYINGATPYSTLGYTPANKAGDTFTGDVYVPRIIDSSDSAYIVDPAGLSSLANIQLNVGTWNNSSDTRNRILFNNLGSTVFMGGNSGGTNFEFRPNGGSTLWSMTGSGDFNATGNITSYFSDFRLKESIKPLDSQQSLDLVNQIVPVSFKFNETGKKLLRREETQVETGFIAQNIKEVFPEAVAIQPLQFEVSDVIIDENDPYLTVRPEKLIPLLVNAVKQLSKENQDLKDRIRDIERKFGE